MTFLDYNRTVVGFHGTRLSTALEVVQRKQPLAPSTSPDDWLGHGAYFWEHAPRQALGWARRRARRQNWGEGVAVLGAMIRLGHCLDLLDPANTEYLAGVYEEYLADMRASGEPIPRNANHRKFLDCSVFEYAYRFIAEDMGHPVDTVRAVYVPTGRDREGRPARVWPRSWVSREAHIQFCVRNPSCILGIWLELISDEPAPTEDDRGEKVSRGTPHPDEQDPSPGGPTAQEGQSGGTGEAPGGVGVDPPGG
jgi:hypothetical protein